MPETKKANKGLLIGIIAGVAAVVVAVVVILILILNKGSLSAGTYKLTKVVEKGVEITGDNLTIMGGETIMTLKEDGTGEVKTSDGTDKITWDKEKGVIISDGTEMKVEVHGNSFTIKANGDDFSQTYTKQ